MLKIDCFNLHMDNGCYQHFAIAFPVIAWLLLVHGLVSNIPLGWEGVSVGTLSNCVYVSGDNRMLPRGHIDRHLPRLYKSTSIM